MTRTLFIFLIRTFSWQLLSYELKILSSSSLYSKYFLIYAHEGVVPVYLWLMNR